MGDAESGNEGLRRVFVPGLRVGLAALGPSAVRHLRDVLRVPEGAVVQAFDAEGRVGTGVVRWGASPALEVAEVRQARAQAGLVLASAVPKGDRADWMVEKLGELGVARWVPLRTARSVVHPEGAGKRARWERIAVEAARQSGNGRMLRVGPLTPLEEFVPTAERPLWVGVTERAGQAPATLPPPGAVLIGPEGGWTEGEVAELLAAGAIAVRFGAAVLRIETAAIVAAYAALSRQQ